MYMAISGKVPAEGDSQDQSLLLRFFLYFSFSQQQQQQQKSKDFHFPLMYVQYIHAGYLQSVVLVRGE